MKNKLSVLGVIFDCKLAKTELQCLLFSYNQGHLKISKDVLVLALQIAQEGNYAGRFTAQKTSLGMVKTSYFLYKKSMVEPISSKVVIMLKAMAFLNLSAKNSNLGRESVRRSQNVG